MNEITRTRKRKKGAVKRNYKDTLFIYLFGRNKEFALSLYNAISGSDHKDPNDIQFNTIFDFIYLGRKNDVSFIIDGQVNIYEHQSTYSPNIPIRMLIYFSRLLEGHIENENRSLYARKRILFSSPRFIVFYNGLDERDDEETMYLSDGFAGGIEGDADLRVRMININFGHNTKLLNECPELYEYAWLISAIREEREISAKLEEALDSVIMKMPDDFRIKKMIERNRAEVTGMLFTEWNEEVERKKWEFSTNEYYKELNEELYKEKWNSRLQELDDQKVKLNDQEQKLNDQREKLNVQEKELIDLKEKLNYQKKELNNQKEELNNQKEELNNQKEELNNQKEELNSQKEELYNQKQELDQKELRLKKEEEDLRARMVRLLINSGMNETDALQYLEKGSSVTQE